MFREEAGEPNRSIAARSIWVFYWKEKDVGPNLKAHNILLHVSVAHENSAAPSAHTNGLQMHREPRCSILTGRAIKKAHSLGQWLSLHLELVLAQRKEILRSLTLVFAQRKET